VKTQSMGDSALGVGEKVIRGRCIHFQGSYFHTKTLKM
jgi:hypothetical protein